MVRTVNTDVMLALEPIERTINNVSVDLLSD